VVGKKFKREFLAVFNFMKLRAPDYAKEIFELSSTNEEYKLGLGEDDIFLTIDTSCQDFYHKMHSHHKAQ